MKKIIMLTTIASLIYSCQKYETLESYGNGMIRLKCELSNGIKDGRCIQYYSNGNILYCADYQKDTLHGTSTFFHQNGELHWEVQFTNGKKEGEVVYFDSLGRKYQISNFKNNELDGTSYMFDENENITFSVEYSMGLKNGEFVKYYGEGKIESLKYYRNDALIDFVNYDTFGNVVDRMIHYSVSEFSLKDSIKLVVEAQNPLHSLIGIQIIIGDWNRIEYASEDYQKRVSIKIPNLNKRDTIRGYLYSFDIVNEENLVVRSKQDFEYVLTTQNAINHYSM